VCATLRCLKTKLASVVNGRLEKGCHENLHIKVVCLGNYLNCEKGIRERVCVRERYIKIMNHRKTFGDAQGHLHNDYISSTFSTTKVTNLFDKGILDARVLVTVMTIPLAYNTPVEIMSVRALGLSH
jgi:hypothetical protein